MEDAMRDGVAAQRERLMEGLRAYGGHYAELSRRFAAWLGLHSTDATAVLEIAAAEERGTPLSPARLSERIALSTGATTALLNRLETAGHITRTREHSDRRVITLRSGPHIQERADEFFGPLAHRLDATMAHYPPDLLARFESFVTDVNSTMDAHLADRSTTSPPSPGD
ncbi:MULTISPECIES: MarR family winged helix-turn-helix transcriptional regulator [Streptomyces]|uniref:MarR family transcriptional regulator n=2 Tax=Streptomyces TaxID=1883 RepID=A0A652L7R0_9ACTN|nr:MULTISPECIES: MarR family transcriptional regulator [unclassified Streptomyces]WSS59955.1 MarR family transcriptional regulator [Streptomyces sp. NBC_01177]WSS67057.1 MarR family transcriptional regulator [Streptomyces sp. NBC_01175]MDX3324327.1 MarR family transcriptional regulator [Streptomyces sp. ME02-6979-3A]MDX3428280.1 MarR family transcriptional regulator [Streptomyces sp. ME01-18a]MDX3684546.1 MarR family transcriptional regulator [Streptomyces sp. AK04-4c]